MSFRARGVGRNGCRDIRIEAHQFIGQFLENRPRDFGPEIYLRKRMVLDDDDTAIFRLIRREIAHKGSLIDMVRIPVCAVGDKGGPGLTRDRKEIMLEEAVGRSLPGLCRRLSDNPAVGWSVVSLQIFSIRRSRLILFYGDARLLDGSSPGRVSSSGRYWPRHCKG